VIKLANWARSVCIFLIGFVIGRFIHEWLKPVPVRFHYPSSLISAIKIKKYYEVRNETVDLKVIKAILDYSKICIAESFPHGPFTAKDLAALAMIESGFSQYAIGKHGERGIFQILDYRGELRELGLQNRDIFDLDVNAKAVCNELRKKYKKYRNYRDAIIAYNGWYRKPDGRIDSQYWNKFMNARRFVDRVWADEKE
jgi:hypothetical protein